MREPDLFLKHYAPVTTHLIFVDVDASIFAQELFLWRKDLADNFYGFPTKVTKEFCKGALIEKFAFWLPVASRTTKIMMSKTQSNWMVVFDNKVIGNSGDTESPVSVISRRLKLKYVSVNFTKDIIPTQVGSTQFAIVDHSQEPVKIRSLAAHKESRWEWHEHGDPLPFEELEAYSFKKIKDRLTFDMVERYCRHLGIDLFDPDFYEGDAYIVNNHPLPNTQYYDEYPGLIK
jgi:hypothetical protein